jgi:large conductance mechanosensitive channel
MSLLTEFREFAVKGNVVDMAVGVIIGAAFGKIVSSLVSDVVTPPLGLVIGGADFKHLVLTLREAQGAQPAVMLKYGVFLQAALDFLIVAMAIFMVVKVVNRLKRAEEAAPAPAPAPVPTKEEELLTEIRDALRAQGRSP